MYLFIYFTFYLKGCQANVIWQDQAKLNMEMVKNAFWDYVAKATQTTEDILQNLKESEIGQEIKWAINNKNFKMRALFYKWITSETPQHSSINQYVILFMADIFIFDTLFYLSAKISDSRVAV